MHHELERGREHYRQRAWADAWQALSLADRAAPLVGEDLELLATSAYLIGRDECFLRALERAHHAHLETGHYRRAARCAFRLGFELLLRGERARATGWLCRAERLLDREAQECVERGYLLLPLVERHLDAGDSELAYAVAARAVGIGERSADADLTASARHQQGRALIQRGELDAGLALLDEAMVAVVAGELSPIITGLLYCSVIDTCRQVYALDRAREWTTALARWCEEQHQMLAFTSVCMVHRSEILQMLGAWTDAAAEARRACERCAQGRRGRAAAAAFYQQGEIHRLRGELEAAEGAYELADREGYEPQPGLALLRLAQGRADAATAAIRRILDATEDALLRSRLLPAYIEIMLAVGAVGEARNACVELERTSAHVGTEMLRALAAHARGAVDLAEGNTRSAVGFLRQTLQSWQRLEMPHAAARTRVLLGLACRQMHDEDGARLEWRAARAVFAQLGATPDLACVDALMSANPTVRADSLTPRELEVLRLVAAGSTNKAIAAQLSLSAKTVERHLSNIFTKLDVPSRAAATAHALRHRLI